MKIPSLTTKWRNMGILEICAPNMNTSFVCRGKITSIDVEDSTMNFRAIDEKHVNVIKANFNPMFMRPILVGEIDGRLVTIDGRHTLLALIALNEEEGLWKGKFDEIYFHVFFGCTRPMGSAVYYSLCEDGKQMAPWDTFHAGCLAQRPMNVTIKDNLKKYGFSTPVDDGVPPSRNADIESWEPFELAWNSGKVWKAGSAPWMVDALCILLSSFRTTDKRLHLEAGKSAFMRALVQILKKFRNYYSPSQLKMWLETQTAAEFKAAASKDYNDRNNGTRQRRGLDTPNFRRAFIAAIKPNLPTSLLHLCD